MELHCAHHWQAAAASVDRTFRLRRFSEWIPENSTSILHPHRGPWVDTVSSFHLGTSWFTFLRGDENEQCVVEAKNAYWAT
jgi:uncharacterized membrane protein